MLRPKERRETTVITTLTQETYHDTKQVDLMVKGLYTGKNTTMRLRQVIVLDSFPEGLIKARVSQLNTTRWPHLRDPVSTQANPPDWSVELLIGQDAPSALMPLEVRRGRGGELFAARTKLGWAVNGHWEQQILGPT